MDIRRRTTLPPHDPRRAVTDLALSQATAHLATWPTGPARCARDRALAVCALSVHLGRLTPSDRPFTLKELGPAVS
ncbi:hypothetical protein [Streptomyces candidus]|uniref:Uncharacterized protein n=1 Tax=Streptomyces candidus TaxID=67283 RepID=A0A7X0LUI7_9ACTN|nr:hypothetical protein [Streptomyces candidus]MBB6440146.1 hypothetical protein [Streptomyces candidus]GHH57603.1 hypothetical protein GCM10018773_65150 [Streptomyces candidus]